MRLGSPYTYAHLPTYCHMYKHSIKYIDIYQTHTDTQTHSYAHTTLLKMKLGKSSLLLRETVEISAIYGVFVSSNSTE